MAIDAKRSGDSLGRRFQPSHWKSWILIGGLATIIAMVFGSIPFVKEFEERSLDLRFRMRRSESVDPLTGSPSFIHPNIVLIGITDNELAEFGPWPWPRAQQAKLLAAFTNNVPRPRAIGYDILFFTANTEEDGRHSDAVFAEMLGRFENICLAGMVRKVSATAKASPSDGPIDYSHIRSHVIPESNTAADTPFFAETVIETPAEIFLHRSHLGMINAVRDEDGVHRRMPILLKAGHYWLPSLSFRLAMLYHQVPLSGVSVLSNKEVVLTRPDGWRLSIPVEPHDEFLVMRINYRGTLRTADFRAVSFSAALKWVQGESDDERINASMESTHAGVVIVGQTATAFDVGATPLDRGTALVDCHLNAVNTLLAGDFVREPPWWATAVTTLCMSLIAAWAVQKFSASFETGLVGAMLLLFLMTSWLLFLKQSIWVKVTIPCTGLLLSYTMGTTLRFMGEERKKWELRRAFQNYLSANIMEEVLKNPAAMQLGGVRKDLTVMFTDVRGFTSFCEKNPPEKVVHVLNDILEIVSEIVIRHNGTLDKYIGDAIMAFWGAPTPGRRPHAESAVFAAHEMRSALARLREEWRQKGLPVLHLGVGINSGEMLVGNVGSSRLRNYTVIGHEVNLAARLEAQARSFETDIILSQATVDRLGPQFRTKSLGEVVVKGAEKPIRIYALDGVVQEVTTETDAQDMKSHLSEKSERK